MKWSAVTCCCQAVSQFHLVSPRLLSLDLPAPQTLSLQEKLRGATLVCQRGDEQNVQLQFSLQQQQAMLTESAARVSELEESQSQLQTQVGEPTGLNDTVKYATVFIFSSAKTLGG